MKRVLVTISAGLFCFCISCNDKKGDDSISAEAQKNLDATHTVTKAFTTGDVSGIDSAVASDFVDHTDRGDMNRDSLKSMIKSMHGVMKDMKQEVIKELADKDYVFSWMRYTGASDGTMGPKGPYDYHGLEIVKFNKDGKAVEHWEYDDPSELMKMMATPKTDTTKKM